MTDTVPPNRFLAALTADDVARAAGWLLLAMSVGLSRPLAPRLFAADGRVLAAWVVPVIDQAQLAAGLAGMISLFSGLAWRRLRTMSLRVSRGTAVLLAGAAAVALLVGEGILRVRNWGTWHSLTARPRPLSSLWDASFRLVPGAYGAINESDFQPGWQHRSEYHVNRFGFRGVLPAIPKPPGLTRVVCLGGSTTFGYTVSDGEEYPALLGQRLGAGVEVVNAARPGATTYRNYSYLRDRLLALEPDVLFFYEGYNDLWRSVQRHRQKQTDYAAVDADLPPTAEPLDLGDPKEWTSVPSFLAERLGFRLEERLRPRPLPRRSPAPFAFHPAIVGIYEKNLRAMVRLARSRGAQPVLATFATADDARLSEAERQKRLRYVLHQNHDLDVDTAAEGIEIYRGITRRVAREEHVPLVDLAAILSGDASLFVDTIHFSPEGERRMAQVLGDALAPMVAAARH
jgi:lysophospholipase L1-like esterase